MCIRDSPKGDGDKFRAWREEYHPGSLVLPIERASGGSRQDLTVEGAGAVYINRRYYLEFLNECLVADGNNILQKKLVDCIILQRNDSNDTCVCHLLCWYMLTTALPSRQSASVSRP